VPRPPHPRPQNKTDYSSLDDTRLAEWAVAVGHHCVVSLDELRRDLAYTKSEIQTRIHRGQLHRVHRGVYAIGHSQLTAKGRWRAAVLACGLGALLSHRPAAALHEVMTIPAGLIDVVAPRRHHHQGLRTHLGEWEGTIVDGIPVTTLPVTYLHLAAIGPPRWVERALEQAQRMDVFDAGPIRVLLQNSPGVAGRDRLQRALDKLPDEPAFTQSELEVRFRELCDDGGIPRPLFNQFIGGHLVDCLWPDRCVVVEVDGWDTHRTRRAFEADRARDVALTLLGCTVLRFTWRQVTDTPDVVAAALKRLL
jgi:hypothetical protein